MKKMLEKEKGTEIVTMPILLYLPLEDQSKHVITILELIPEIIRVTFVSNISANDFVWRYLHESQSTIL